MCCLQPDLQQEVVPKVPLVCGQCAEKSRVASPAHGGEAKHGKGMAKDGSHASGRMQKA